MGLPLEQSPYADVAPFAVDDEGVLKIVRGYQWKGNSKSADPGEEAIPISRVSVITVALQTASVVDHGATFIAATTVGVTLQLPAASVMTGLTVTLVNGVLPTSNSVKAKPAAGDTIVFTSAAASSSLENSTASDVLGDNVTLVSDGVSKWYIVGKTGTWTAVA